MNDNLFHTQPEVMIEVSTRTFQHAAGLASVSHRAATKPAVPAPGNAAPQEQEAEESLILTFS
jgi:hypothetical protein